jgi:hypothetical protein
MISSILTFGVIAGAGIIAPLLYSKSPTYGSRLEEYIISNNPKDTADVERLTREYDMSVNKGFL